MNTLLVIAVSAVTSAGYQMVRRVILAREVETTECDIQSRPAPRHAKPELTPAQQLGTIQPTVDPYDYEQRAFAEILHDSQQGQEDAGYATAAG
jgi:hypothetical protein